VTATVSETGEQAAAREAYAALGEADPAMHRLLAVYGAPDAFAFKDAGRTAGNMFGALVLHILSQQISTWVAFVLYDRLAAAGDGQVLPEVVLRLGETGVRGLGTSQAKASYVHGLARSVSAGDLDLKGLKTRSDREAAAALTAIRGIGDWTAQMFLIYQLRRPDILPAGDMGIRNAIWTACRLGQPPSVGEVERMGSRWAPHRTYAAALLWVSLRRAGPG
jgi:DNA-3-methyladenine glycosylase II